MLGPKQAARAIAGQLLDDIGVLLPAVVASRRVSLGIFVSEDGAENRQHFRIGVILRWNELDTVGLSRLFASERVVNYRIARLQKLAMVITGPVWGLRHGDLTSRR